MVLKNKGHVGTLVGLAGVVALGVASTVNVNCNRGREYINNEVVVEKSETEIYIDTRRKILDNLEKVAGGRVFDRNALFSSKIENKDLETFVKIYNDDEQFRKDENWGDDYEGFSPNSDVGFEKLIGYEKDTPGLHLIPKGYLSSPNNYIWSDEDKTAIAQYMIMKGDVDFGTITF